MGKRFNRENKRRVLKEKETKKILVIMSSGLEDKEAGHVVEDSSMENAKGSLMEKEAIREETLEVTTGKKKSLGSIYQMKTQS